MDSASEEILLQKLEEFVFDEDKILTNAIVCEKLDLSLNEAKHLLEKFVSDQKINPGKISITYLVCGKLQSGEYVFQIIDGLYLKDKKKAFKNITNEVVYSVQKSNVVDFNLIALSETSERDELSSKALKGSVISEKCTERIIQTKVLPPLPPQKNFEKQKPSSFFKPITKPQSNGDVKKPDTLLKSQSNGDKPHGIKDSVTKKASGLASFLSQPSQNLKKKHSSSEEDVEAVKKVKLEENEINEEKVILESKKSTDENDTIESSIKEETKAKKKTPKKSVNKKKEDQDGRKRKRIIVESDSEDDMFGKDEDEKMDVIESDEEKLVQIKPKVEVVPVPKNKRRKAVEKTYEDEDGYIVTRTEYVLVSASEDEEETKPRINEKETKNISSDEPKVNKKVSPVKSSAKTKKGKSVATNQPTLMNFFKKK